MSCQEIVFVIFSKLLSALSSRRKKTCSRQISFSGIGNQRSRRVEAKNVIKCEKLTGIEKYYFITCILPTGVAPVFRTSRGKRLIFPNSLKKLLILEVK